MEAVAQMHMKVTQDIVGGRYISDFGVSKLRKETLQYHASPNLKPHIFITLRRQISKYGPNSRIRITSITFGHVGTCTQRILSVSSLQIKTKTVKYSNDGVKMFLTGSE